MRVNAEKVIAILIVLLSASNLYIMLTTKYVYPITEEEATEISRNTPIVQKALSIAESLMIIEAEYWSADYIRLQKEKFLPDKVYELELLPAEHGVWRVHWDNEAPGYQIVHFVDEQTTQILYESWFVAG